MTPEKAIEVRDFAINWIENVHHRSRKATKAECKELFKGLIDDDPSYDSYDVLSWDGWDSCEGRYGRPACDFWTECRDYSFWGRVYSSRVIDLCETACRVAIDLLVKQSGGVVGYTIGDLKKAFSGTIPQWVCDRYETDLNEGANDDPIWL
jgi:hypothetical protein